MRKERILNPRYPHRIRIVRRNINASNNGDPEDPLFVNDEDADEETVLYEGAGRSFTDTTTTGTSDVAVNRRKASIPVRFDEWASGMKPLNGDTIYATVGSCQEIGMVRDCESDNNRTLVYWDLTRV